MIIAFGLILEIEIVPYHMINHASIFLCSQNIGLIRTSKRLARIGFGIFYSDEICLGF